MVSLKKISLVFAFAGGLQVFNLSPSKAHSIQSELNFINGKIELKSEFSNGSAVQGAVVRYIKPNGIPAEEIGRLNYQGRLIFDLPDIHNGEVELQVDGGPGHRDYLLLPIRFGNVQLDQVVLKPYTLKQKKNFFLNSPLDFVAYFSSFLKV